MKTTSFSAPTLTQYRQTVFRSKSEAVFARALDLVDAEWIYEPFAGKGDAPADHQWDFLVFLPYLTNQIAAVNNHTFQGNRVCYSYEPWLIEYKPISPNATYINNLLKRLKTWNGKTFELNYGLIYGNPWSRDSDVDGYALTPLSRVNAWKYNVFFFELNLAVKEAVSYRYDLCNLPPNETVEYRYCDRTHYESSL